MTRPVTTVLRELAFFSWALVFLACAPPPAVAKKVIQPPPPAVAKKAIPPAPRIVQVLLHDGRPVRGGRFDLRCEDGTHRSVSSDYQGRLGVRVASGARCALSVGKLRLPLPLAGSPVRVTIPPLRRVVLRHTGLGSSGQLELDQRVPLPIHLWRHALALDDDGGLLIDGVAVGSTGGQVLQPGIVIAAPGKRPTSPVTRALARLARAAAACTSGSSAATRPSIPASRPRAAMLQRQGAIARARIARAVAGCRARARDRQQICKIGLQQASAALAPKVRRILAIGQRLAGLRAYRWPLLATKIHEAHQRALRDMVRDAGRGLTPLVRACCPTGCRALPGVYEEAAKALATQPLTLQVVRREALSVLPLPLRGAPNAADVVDTAVRTVAGVQRLGRVLHGRTLLVVARCAHFDEAWLRLLATVAIARRPWGVGVGIVLLGPCSRRLMWPSVYRAGPAVPWALTVDAREPKVVLLDAWGQVRLRIGLDARPLTLAAMERWLCRAWPCAATRPLAVDDPPTIAVVRRAKRLLGRGHGEAARRLLEGAVAKADVAGLARKDGDLRLRRLYVRVLVKQGAWTEASEQIRQWRQRFGDIAADVLEDDALRAAGLVAPDPAAPGR